MPWTEKMQEQLEELAADKLSSAEIAKAMGISMHAVKRRAVRTRVKIYRPEDRNCGSDCAGIRPFTPKCAELLRAAGVRV